MAVVQAQHVPRHVAHRIGRLPGRIDRIGDGQLAVVGQPTLVTDVFETPLVPLAVIVWSGVVIGYPWASDLTFRMAGEAPPPRAAGPGAPGGPGAAAAAGVVGVAMATACAAGTPSIALGVATCVAYVSQFMSLQPGDMLMLGTAAGRPRVRAGDRVEIKMPALGTLTNLFVAEAA